MKDLLELIENYLEIGDCYKIIEFGQHHIVVQDMENRRKMQIKISSVE